MNSKILLVCMILGLSAAVNTTYAVNGPAMDYNEVISNYMDSYMTGNYKKMGKILSEDVHVKTPRLDTVLVQNKDNLLTQIKQTGSIDQNCRSNYEVLDKSDAMIIARVDFKYNDFTQRNYLVLEKNDNKQWEITQVCKFFGDAKVSAQPATNVTASN